MKIVVPLGFSGVCAAIAAYFFKTDDPGWGFLFIGVGVAIVILSILLGSKGSS
jgi:hypothetical protein